MPDREKVIKGLGNVANAIVDGYICEPDQAVNTIADALSLLKEQEPIMIKTVMINGSGRNGRCQNCLMMLNEVDYPNFCGNCGQAVKWE